jgi:hypothetical protein
MLPRARGRHWSCHAAAWAQADGLEGALLCCCWCLPVGQPHTDRDLLGWDRDVALCALLEGESELGGDVEQNVYIVLAAWPQVAGRAHQTGQQGVTVSHQRPSLFAVASVMVFTPAHIHTGA